MKYGLPKTTIEKIRGVFARFPEIDKAVLYGSRAKGNYQAGSDIDLTLYGDALTPDLRDKIVDALDDLLLPYTIDLSLFDELDHAKLREHIERVGVVFYERVSQGSGIGTGWETKTIGQVCEIVNGGTPKTSVKKFWDGNHQWITPAEMGNRSTPYVSKTERKITDEGLSNSSAKLMPPKSVILSSRAPIGHLVINTEFMATNQGCKGLVPSDKLHYKFLYYYLFGNVGLLNSLGTGATFKELSGGKLKEVPIPLPPLPEQKRIVSILDEAFAGIATATANAKKNLANARELFESTLQSVFTQKGEGWIKTKLGAVYDVRDGTHDSPKYHAIGYPLITSKNLKREGLDFCDVKLISEDDYIKINARSRVHKGDILFAMIGTIGNPTVVMTEPNFAIKNVALFKLNLTQSSNFLKYYLDSQMVISKMMSEAKGTTQKFVGLGYLRDFPIHLPPLRVQQAIVDKLDELSIETQRLEAIYQQKLVALDELKKSILNQAFSGQLH